MFIVFVVMALGALGLFYFGWKNLFIGHPYSNAFRLHQRLSQFSNRLVLDHNYQRNPLQQRHWFFLYHGWRLARQQKQCEIQLPEVLDWIARALRAGHSLTVALNLASQDAADPLGNELRMAVEGLRYGRSMDECLHQMVKRLPGTDLRFVVIAILVQRETGGNLAELLGRVAQTLRARLVLKGFVKSRSAEGRFSATLLTALPCLLLAWIAWASPHAFALLFFDPMGQRLTALSTLALLTGTVWVWSLSRVQA
jgi:tight adherence protein B